MPHGMTMIELIVALAVVAIALVLGGIAFGAMTGAETKQGAGDVSTAVRYTYNLAAINNRTYALFLDLDNHSYHVAPVASDGECDRILLNMDGGDSAPMVSKYGETGGKTKKDDDEEARGMFDAVQAGSDDPGPPAWVDDSSTAVGKLEGMSRHADMLDPSYEPKEEDVSDEVKKTGEKRLKTMRRNELAKPRKLPPDVKFDGVLLREDGDRVTEGVVPILFYPHGYTQRALIYIKGGDGPDVEAMTVEIMTMQGTGKVHGDELDASAFREEAD